MGHRNPFNGRCVHGKEGVRYEKGAQMCKCDTTKGAEKQPLRESAKTDDLGFPRCVR